MHSALETHIRRTDTRIDFSTDFLFALRCARFEMFGSCRCSHQHNALDHFNNSKYTLNNELFPEFFLYLSFLSNCLAFALALPLSLVVSVCVFILFYLQCISFIMKYDRYERFKFLVVDFFLSLFFSFNFFSLAPFLGFE